ncbi:F-box/kelch-repeat protein [Raphanus sativus]|uniref:F-box/kelch-repeat protein At4g38940-like n=1 Tax=Raphanus sativus TaxID=3726 RepID=A0A6J0KD61_RAPSA|nr:F-box/kelch-repeat protein At4g38940-like [Raphanus sativus]KAJ4884185.1 F-box/kelch-repeat protein [Raphanus sativus]
MSSNIRAKKKQLPSSSPIKSLPEDIVVDILARVSACDYPRASLVSKYFRSLVSSREIYARRSSLGCTEHFFYVVHYDTDNRHDCLYTLRGKEKPKGLVRISGLPDMPRDGSYVAVGSRIYVFSGMMTSSAFFIDCTSHTVQHLPKMPVPLCGIVADVIGRRIYVFGYHGTDQVICAVFDTETQMWEDGMKNAMDIFLPCLVVMADKMYMMGIGDSFVYDPKESKWETDEVLSSKYWVQKVCVVDDVLYFYDYDDKEVRAYDPEHKCWGVVKGLDDFLVEMRRAGGCWPVPMSYAGKLVLFFHKPKIIGEILLERRRGGQIWGKVGRWYDHGLTTDNFYITKSLAVVL